MGLKIPLSNKLFHDTLESPIGILYFIFDGDTLQGLAFKKPFEVPRKGRATILIKNELNEYFKNGIEEFTQKIKLTKGTEFDRKVWLTLKEIPYGETRTYKWLAEKIGKPNASRAVGQSLSRNPIPIILPCHRIIESDGSIGGYSSGPDIKRRLLETEYYIKLAKTR
ncbi:MAG: hypothetical protein A2Y97_00945 [Nitrospirae bacterium RBG_13_39_12]|nr:MAG: hypothetical protein A2Y97_00945 [Nitrospirae bacterium RBG_13_39_12]